MQYRFEKGRNRLVAVITDLEGTDLDEVDLIVKNMKTFEKLSIEKGLINDPTGSSGDPYAVIPKDLEGLLGRYDVDDLRLYAKRKEKVVLEGFE